MEVGEDSVWGFDGLDLDRYATRQHVLGWTVEEDTRLNILAPGGRQAFHIAQHVEVSLIFVALRPEGYSLEESALQGEDSRTGLIWSVQRIASGLFKNPWRL